MRSTSEGQVTIPIAIRENLDLLPETEVEFVVDGDSVRIVKAGAPKAETRGPRAARLLREARGHGIGLTTEEIPRAGLAGRS